MKVKIIPEAFKHHFPEPNEAQGVDPLAVSGYMEGNIYKDTAATFSGPRAQPGLANEQALKICDRMGVLGFSNFDGLRDKFNILPSNEFEQNQRDLIKKTMEGILYTFENTKTPPQDVLVAQYKDRQFVCADGTLTNLQSILADLSLGNQGIDAYVTQQGREYVTQTAMEMYRKNEFVEFRGYQSFIGMEIHNIASLVNSCAPEYGIKVKTAQEDHYITPIFDETRQKLSKALENGLQREEVVSSFAEGIARNVAFGLPTYTRGKYQNPNDFSQEVAEAIGRLNVAHIIDTGALVQVEEYLPTGYKPNIESIIKDASTLYLHEKGVLQMPEKDLELTNLRIALENSMDSNSSHNAITQDVLDTAIEKGNLEYAMLYAVDNKLKLDPDEFPEQDPIMYAIAKDIKIDGFEAIKYAIDNNIKIEGLEAIKYAIVNDRKIDGLDPMKYVIDSNIKIDGLEPIKYVIDNNIKIDGLEPIVYAINNDVFIDDKNPVIYAIDSKLQVNGIDPMKYAIDKNIKIKVGKSMVQGSEPMRYAVDYNMKIEGLEAIKYALVNDIKIEGKDPVIYAYRNGGKIDGLDPMKYVVDNNIKINGLEPIVYAINNDVFIDGKNPVLYAIDSKLQVNGIDPMKYAIDKNIKIKVGKSMVQGAEPMRYAVDCNMKIEGLEAIKYAIVNDIKIGGKDPVIYAYRNGGKIDGLDPMKYVVDNNIKIDGFDPIVYATNNSLSVDDRDPMVYAIDNNIKIDGFDPIKHAIDNNIKIDYNDPMKYAVVYSNIKIDGIEPMKYAIDNKIKIYETYFENGIKEGDRKIKKEFTHEPMKYAIIKNIKIDGLEPMKYAVNNNIKIDGLDNITREPQRPKESELKPDKELGEKLDKIKEDVSTFTRRGSSSSLPVTIRLPDTGRGV